VAGLAKCAGCLEWFAVPAAPPAPSAFGPELEAPVAAVRQLTPEEALQEQREGIRSQAFGFSLAAVLLAIASGFSLFEAVSGQESSMGAWAITGGLWGASIWLYLIAQVIHIRANTHK